MSGHSAASAVDEGSPPSSIDRSEGERDRRSTRPARGLIRPGPREKELWKRFTERRDIVARDELVRIYMPVAVRLARRYGGIREPFEDLLQVAALGLVNAVNRFDPARGTPFVGFAKPTILGELKRHLRDKIWTVRVPRSLHDLMGRIEKATEDLTSEVQRPPSVDELARHLRLDPSEVRQALEAEYNRRALPLDAPLASGDHDETSAAPEWTGEVERGYELAEDRAMLRALLPDLDAREVEILRLRFVDELPQSQIAERLGVSPTQVSRLQRRTLKRLRARAGGTGRPAARAR